MFNWIRKNTRSSRSRKKSSGKPGAGASSAKSKSSDAAERRFGWREARPFALIAAALAAVAGGAVAWAAGRPMLIEYIASRHVHPVHVAFTGKIPPVELLETQLSQRVEAVIGSGPFEIASLQRAYDAMLASCWFEPATLRVRRDLSDAADLAIGESPSEISSGAPAAARVCSIVIEGEFRQPFAFVRSGDSDMLVDRQGNRLPVSYAAGEVTQLIAIIQPAGAPPRVGEQWRGADVHDGLELIHYLLEQDRQWLNQVRAIDVSNAGGRDRSRAHLEIVTDLDRRVAWGRGIGAEAGIDIPPEQKIMLLDDQYKNFGGRIDHPQGTLRVNLQLKSVDG